MSGRIAWRGRGAARIALAAVAVLGAAIGLGWRAGRPEAVPAAGLASTPWVLPTEPAADPERDATVLRARRPWGGAAGFRDSEAAPPPAASQPWLLVGTIVRDGHHFALIQTGPQHPGKLEYRAVGDRLPDGGILERVDADGVAVASGPGRDARRSTRRLFQKTP